MSLTKEISSKYMTNIFIKFNGLLFVVTLDIERSVYTVLNQDIIALIALMHKSTMAKMFKQSLFIHFHQMCLTFMAKMCNQGLLTHFLQLYFTFMTKNVQPGFIQLFPSIAFFFI
jgi:hypothetical protein